VTTIEWTNSTLNPIRARNRATGGIGHYCFKVSPECENCYAETFQPRVNNVIRFAKQDERLVEVFIDQKVAASPMFWTKPRMIFLCSMTDIFGEFVRDEWIDYIVAVAAITPRHRYQVLTKRAQRMLDYWSNPGLWRRIAAHIRDISRERTPAGVLLNEKIARSLEDGVGVRLDNWAQGVSAGTQAAVNERVPLLLSAPVAGRWVSAEPILEDLDFTKLPIRGTAVTMNALRRSSAFAPHVEGIVVGGESGRNARNTVIGHIRGVVKQCDQFGTRVHVKQLGARPVNREGEPHPITHSKGGLLEEMPVDLRRREFYP